MITNRRLLTTDYWRLPPGDCLPARSRRAGFTLIEMLVVVIIIIVLATIAVAITPRIAGEQKVAKGADQVQGWLLIAKSRAKRDQIPTGVRLIPDPNNPNYVRELQYVQQPDDFVGGKVSAQNNRVNADPNYPVDFTGGFSDQSIYPVQPGDYIEFLGGGQVHKIATVASTVLTLGTWLTHPIASTSQYRIIRKPRVLIGETPMLLAQDIVIDISTNNTYGNAISSADIMFSPAGSLMTTVGGNKSFLALWIRDVTADAPQGGPPFPVEYGGNPIVVCIYRRAGFIAAHPVDVANYSPQNPPLQPYTFATDGKSSGL